MGDVFVHVDYELQFLFEGFLTCHVDQVGDCGAEFVFGRQNLQFSGFNFGEVQDVVYDFEQSGP